MANNSTSDEGQSSLYLRIMEEACQEKKLRRNRESNMFEARREASDTAKTEASFATSTPSSTAYNSHAPEKEVTLFALRLALLEKSASGLGTLGFIWATVVLLGGFAITLDKIDFWVITTILLVEGARIFSRSHELEWQHQATWSLPDTGDCIGSDMQATSSFLPRTLWILNGKAGQFSSLSRRQSSRNLITPRSDLHIWLAPHIPLLPYKSWFFLSKNISRILYWLQLISASACMSLALMRLVQQDYGVIRKEDVDRRNRDAALNIFYSLALAEALLFLMERAYWEWKISCCKLLEEVNRECGFRETDLVSVRRFFYDAYQQCIDGSIFDGLRMDLVSFASELLQSSSSDEQLTAARILCSFATNERFSGDVLRKIGSSSSSMERLLEILNWNRPSEIEIRKSAAEILSRLAGKKQNALRVAELPGALESISSLLHTGRNPRNSADEIGQKKVELNDRCNEFNRLGLLILKKLARDLDNCAKIGNTRGLLAKIIDLTHAGEVLAANDPNKASQIVVVNRSLEVLKMLVSSPGTTGKTLRRDVSDIIFAISNIREILQFGKNHTQLLKLSLDVLKYLAIDEHAREKIGRTGGMVKGLMCIFLSENEVEVSVRMTAAEALAMLALESESNCNMILRLDVIEKLVQALHHPELNVNSARLIRNLCIYARYSRFHQLKHLVAATPIVFKAIMSEENKLQEMALGLAPRLLRFSDSRNADLILASIDVKTTELATRLVHILKTYRNPSTKMPRIRRFVIELAIWLMNAHKDVTNTFRSLGFAEEIEMVADTTSEIECFNVFSGSVGLCPHRTTIQALVDNALERLNSG